MPAYLIKAVNNTKVFVELCQRVEASKLSANLYTPEYRISSYFVKLIPNSISTPTR